VFAVTVNNFIIRECRSNRVGNLVSGFGRRNYSENRRLQGWCQSRPLGNHLGQIGVLQNVCAYLCACFCKLLLFQFFIIVSSPSAAALSISWKETYIDLKSNIATGS
jgi:hypothetical protein